MFFGVTDPLFVITTFGWEKAYQLTNVFDYRNVIRNKQQWPTTRIPNLADGTIWDPTTLVEDMGEDVCGTGRPPTFNRHVAVSFNLFNGNPMFHLRRKTQDGEMYLNFSSRYDLSRLLFFITTLTKTHGDTQDVDHLKFCLEKSLELLN